MAINFNAFKKVQNTEVKQTKSTNVEKEQKLEKKQNTLVSNVFNNLKEKTIDLNENDISKLMEEFLAAANELGVEEETEEVDEFAEMDADGDGNITKEEYENYQNKKLADMFRDYDFDGDGKISPQEAARFAEMDLNGDGKISDYERGYYDATHRPKKIMPGFPTDEIPGSWHGPDIYDPNAKKEDPILFNEPAIYDPNAERPKLKNLPYYLNPSENENPKIVEELKQNKFKDIDVNLY